MILVFVADRLLKQSLKAVFREVFLARGRMALAADAFISPAIKNFFIAQTVAARPARAIDRVRGILAYSNTVLSIATHLNATLARERLQSLICIHATCRWLLKEQLG